MAKGGGGISTGTPGANTTPGLFGAPAGSPSMPAGGWTRGSGTAAPAPAAGGNTAGAPLGSLTPEEQNKLVGYNMSIAINNNRTNRNPDQAQSLYALRQPLMDKLRSGGGGGAPPPGTYSGGRTPAGMPAGGYGPQGGGGNDAYDYYRNQLAGMLANRGGYKVRGERGG